VEAVLSLALERRDEMSWALAGLDLLLPSGPMSESNRFSSSQNKISSKKNHTTKKGKSKGRKGAEIH